MANLILISLFPLIGLIVTGYFIKRLNFVDEGFWKGAEKLNYYVLFPAMLFLNLAYAEINLAIVRHMMVAILITISIACIVLYGLRHVLKTPTARFGVYMQANVRFNTYIGLAVIATLLQQQGMALFAIMLAVCIPLVNILSVLAMTKKEDMNVIKILVSLVKNPLIMGCVVGAAFNAMNLSLWQGFENFIEQLGRCSLPLGLLTVGAALQFVGLKDDVFPLLTNTVTRLLAMPLMALGLCTWIGLPQLETQVIVLFFALPTASASYILTKVLGGDSRLMASVISLQTLCSAITLPLMMYLIM